MNLLDTDAPHQPDPGRLARAVRLDAVRLEDGSWWVTGGAEPHRVDATLSTCDCYDFESRGTTCKHILRCQLADGDAATIAAMRAFVAMPKRQRRKAAR